MTAPEKPMDEVVATVRQFAGQAVAIWMRAAQHLFRNGLALAKLPVELLGAEDPCLGVGSTTVFFPRGPAPPSLVVEDVRVSGSTGSAQMKVSVVDHTQDRMPVRVELLLPGGTSSALCTFTLREEQSNVRRRYFLPFGVPGRRR